MKLFKRNGLAIVLAIFSIVLSACGNDKKAEPPVEDKIGSVEYVVKVTAHDDLKSVADIKCEWYNANHAIKTINAVDGVLELKETWTNNGKVLGDKKFRLVPLLALKSGVKIEEGRSYQLNMQGTIDVTVKDKQGEVLASKTLNVNFGYKEAVPAEHVIEVLNPYPFEFGFKIFRKVDGTYIIS